ncbi:MAG: DUF2007 domain-containing protein [Myxococcota bacterium]
MDTPSEDTVLLATYSDTMQANIAKGQLEESGIAARLSDEDMVNVHPLLGSAAGGVKLWVPESEASDAKELLEEATDDSDPLAPGDGEVLSLDDEDQLPDTILTCPKCGSQDIGFAPAFSVFWAVVVLTVAVPMALPVSKTIGFAITGGLAFLGIVLMALRKFPLQCKDCSERGARSHFEDNPRADLALEE